LGKIWLRNLCLKCHLAVVWQLLSSWRKERDRWILLRKLRRTLLDQKMRKLHTKLLKLICQFCQKLKLNSYINGTVKFKLNLTKFKKKTKRSNTISLEDMKDTSWEKVITESKLTISKENLEFVLDLRKTHSKRIKLLSVP